MNRKLLVWKTKYVKKLYAAIKLLFVTDKQSFNYLLEGILISSRVGNGTSVHISSAQSTLKCKRPMMRLVAVRSCPL